ncbi:hypothetical protein ACWDLG_40510 [Nonomuraea sp. NPDC003727]
MDGGPADPQPAADVVLDPAATSTVDAMGRKTAYAYWMDNRLRQRIADGAKRNGSATPADVVEPAEYDPAGNLTQQINGGGLVTTGFVVPKA